VTVTVTHTTAATLPNDPAKEVSSDAWNQGHTVAGLGDSAEKNVGTAAGTVAAGDHLHTGVYEPAGVAAADITDSSATGRSVLTGDAAAGRTALGLGDSATKNVGTAAGTVAAGDHTHPGGSEAFPVGSVFIAVVSTNPGTLLGYGTWSAFGAGKVLIGIDSGDTDFDTVEETGGAKTKAISAHAGTAVSAHAGTAVADHASHTHQYTEIVQHTHTVNITDNGHVHAQASQTATTGGVSSWEHGAIDTSSTAAETLNTASATTGITATTSNPAGSVATGTTIGPNATLTHSVTQPSAHTVTQPNSHTDLNVVQPYIVVYMWKRTA
jgi:hypothetical protein